jgi:hypothetical protein
MVKEITLHKCLTVAIASGLVSLMTVAVAAQEKKEIIIREMGSDKKGTVIIVEKSGQSAVVKADSGPSNVTVSGPNAFFINGDSLAQSGQPLPTHFSVAIAGEAMPFENKVVKGMPYSADAVTEFTQTLPDGNRIQRKSESQIYRDGEGRTRREFSPMMVGPMMVGSMQGAPDLGKSIQIVDPVAGTTMILDPRSRTVSKMPSIAPAFSITRDEKGPETGAERVELKVTTNVESENGSTRIITRRIEGNQVVTEDVKNLDTKMFTFIKGAAKNLRTENLGKQTIDGIEAEGTRTVETIPAGEVGNEKQIEIVNERWYSNDLQLVLLTRHVDPRFGENLYRVINVNRAEPDASLFVVPADYKVNESPTMMKMIKKIEIQK